MENVTWSVVEFHRVFKGRVPEDSGIYAVVLANRVMGIPLATTPVYVGKSKNLRRRLCSAP